MNEIEEESLWNLDITIAKFILPRLKAFKEKAKGYPAKLSGIEQWREILDKMIFAFDKVVSTFDRPEPYSEEEHDKIDEGLKLFAKYYHDLWW